MEADHTTDELVKVLIGSANADVPRVEELRAKLTAEGFVVLKDPGDVSSGADWKESFRTVIRDSRFFLIGLSNNSVDQQGRLEKTLRSKLEILWKGLNNETWLLPVRLEECLVPEKLLAFTPVDLFVKDGFGNLLEAMNVVIRRRKSLAEAFSPELMEQSVPEPSSIFDSEETEYGSLEGPEDPHSVYDWCVDITRLLAGEREDSLERLGGVEEYVSVMIEEAADPSTAKVAFEHALEKVVQNWQSSVIESEVSPDYLLDLVSAYTPENAFVKVLAFAITLRRLLERNANEATHLVGPPLDLYLKAFVTLENYYPRAPQPPADSAASYQTYIGLLKEDRNSPEFCGYAIRRLVELKEMALGGREIEELIRLNPKSLSALVKLVLDPVRRSSAENDLSIIYTLCLNAGDQAELEFEKAVLSSGGGLKRFDETTPHVLFNEASFELHLPPRAVYQYWEIMQMREMQLGLQKDEFMQRVHAGNGWSN
jgi:hypothetical protein